MFYRFLIIVVLSAGFLGFAAKPDRDTDAIAKIRTEWAANLHAKQLDRIMGLYAADAIFLQPNGERITGQPAIRELTQRVMAKFTSDITLHSVLCEHSGNLAYDSGDFSENLTVAADGSVIHGQGSYLMIFKRQKDGRWLIAEQVWTESSGHN